MSLVLFNKFPLLEQSKQSVHRQSKTFLSGFRIVCQLYIAKSRGKFNVHDPFHKAATLLHYCILASLILKSYNLTSVHTSSEMM